MDLDSVLDTCMLEQGLPGKRGGNKSGRNVSHNRQIAATALQQSMEEWTYKQPDRLSQAKTGALSLPCLPYFTYLPL